MTLVGAPTELLQGQINKEAIALLQQTHVKALTMHKLIRLSVLLFLLQILNRSLNLSPNQSLSHNLNQSLRE